MILRKITASFLVIMFVVLAMPNFLLYGLSRTYLNTDFYRRDELVQGVYDFALDETVALLRQKSEMFKGYFDEMELRGQLEKVFTKKIFSETLTDFASQIDDFKRQDGKSLVLSLRTLRANLLTVGNNLAYLIYQKLPTCSEADAIQFSQNDGVPECVPPAADYEDVMRPVTENFEATIYNEIPEELSNFDQAVPLREMVKIEGYRNLSFLLLLGLMAMIVLVVYGKITTILSYLFVSFLLGGAVGYGFSYALSASVANYQGQLTDVRSQQFLVFMLGFLIGEIQRLSVMFMIVAVALFLIRFVLKRTVEDKKGISAEEIM